MNINELAENLGLEPDEYMEILELLVDSGKADIASLEQAIAANDAEGVVKAAHSLKGASANLGLMDLSETARDIEFKGREQDLADIGEKIQVLKAKFAPVIELFQS
ncbi:MAG: Hpt domain-containing protein [Deltaproteobacteria bacterium]|nr:Hpt domain-containing protein [Deltaproteobacteria bacterium]